MSDAAAVCRLRCIYCSQEKAALSVEHVVPLALGGTLELRQAVCRGCNNALSAMEQPVIEKLSLLRAMWVSPELDRHGAFGIPARIADAEGVNIKGRRIRLNRDGTWGPPDPILQRQEVAEDSRIAELWRVFRTGDTERLRQRRMVRHPDVEETRGAGGTAEFTVEIRIGCEVLLMPEAHRLAAKCAFNYLACRCGANLCLGSEFDAVRTFILGASALDPAICDVVGNPRTERGVNTPVPMHSITLVSSGALNQLRAIVGLFGMFFFLVTLAPRRTGLSEWWFAHEFQPWTGGHRDRELGKTLIGAPAIQETTSVSVDELRRRASAATARAVPRLREAVQQARARQRRRSADSGR